jgi:hypothetical protein
MHNLAARAGAGRLAGGPYPRPRRRRRLSGAHASLAKARPRKYLPKRRRVRANSQVATDPGITGLAGSCGRVSSRPALSKRNELTSLAGTPRGESVLLASQATVNVLRACGQTVLDPYSFSRGRSAAGPKLGRRSRGCCGVGRWFPSPRTSPDRYSALPEDFKTLPPCYA